MLARLRIAVRYCEGGRGRLGFSLVVVLYVSGREAVIFSEKLVFPAVPESENAKLEMHQKTAKGWASFNSKHATVISGKADVAKTKLVENPKMADIVKVQILSGRPEGIVACLTYPNSRSEHFGWWRYPNERAAGHSSL